MSKLSFRARALDASKPLPIYHARDVPDISDYQAINRTVPQMPTGMEKEEETERHLQEVILAQQTNCLTAVMIPTPEVDDHVAHYRKVYEKLPQRQSPYIRVPGLGLEEEVPDYDLDSEDEEWLSAQTKERPLSPLHFEKMMDKLERGSGNTVLSVRDAQSLLKDEEDLVIAVYDYWLAKRLRLGRALIPAVKHERRDGTSSSNPYLAFRKRTEKMQTRKNRKNDEMAYMQMLKLKRDLAKAKNLAEMLLQRETKKHQLAKVETDIFRRRYQLEDWSGSIMSSLRPVSTHSDSSFRPSASSVSDSWDSRHAVKGESGDHVQMVGRQPVLLSTGLKKKSKKKKFYFPPGTSEPELVTPATPEKALILQSTTMEKMEEEELLDGIFTFKRRPHVRYHRVLEEQEEDWDISQGVPLSLHSSSWSKYQYNTTAFGESFIGRARRRVGRGGRVLWDRMGGSESDDEAELEDPFSSSVSGGTENFDPSLKRCRFVSRSPSPTSNFEFQTFPHIETTDPLVPPTDPVTSMAIFEFGGFTSDSELPEDASSFSSLPTSQFALKPSSSDVECDSSQDEKMDTSLSLLPPPPRSSSSSSSLQRLASQDPVGTKSHPVVPPPSSNPPGPSGTPSLGVPNSILQTDKSFTLKPPPVDHKHQQQQQQMSLQQNLSPALQNLAHSANPTRQTPLLVPTPSLSSSPAATATPTTLPTTTSSLTTSQSTSLSKPVSVPDQESGMGSSSATPISLSTPIGGDHRTIKKASDTGGTKAPSPQVTHKLVDPRLAKHNQQTHEPQKADSSLKQQQQPIRVASPLVNSGAAPSSTSTTNTSPSSSVLINNHASVCNSNSNSGSGLNLKSDGRPAAPNGLTPSPTQPVVKSEPSSAVDKPRQVVSSISPSPPVNPSWLMDGPSSNILLLSSSGTSDNNSVAAKSPKTSPSIDKNVTLSTNDAALLVTSQLLQHGSAGNASGGGGGGGDLSSGRPIDQLQTALQQTRGVPLGLNREIPLPMVAGTIPMTSSRLPTPNPIPPMKLEGHPQQQTQQVFEKRTVGGGGPALLTRRASATTNGGTSYPEIFHTAARRFSETTERGLKQALAGMNHNSLLDATANSLVQPRPKPSEVS